jgi:hypothetical protein
MDRFPIKDILMGILWGTGLFVLYWCVCWELNVLTPFIYVVF